MIKNTAILLLFIVSSLTFANDKLTGTIISDASSTAMTSASLAFDGDIDTYFQSDFEERAWVGYDLGTTHIIEKVRWCPRFGSFNRAITTFTRKGNTYALNNTYRYEQTDYGYYAQVAIFQGANKPDFSDAINLHVIQKQGIGGEFEEAEIHVTRAFRYVRFVASAGSMGNISEVEFYGNEGEGSEDRFYQATNLPLVSINIKDSKEVTSQLNQDTLRAYITIVSDDGKSIFQDSCVIRGRGNDSFRYPKKPYRLKFYKKQRLLDAPANAKKWTLINSYGDKALMRNYLSFDFYKRVGAEYVPYCRLVDLIINGDYKGTYQLCDQLEVNKNRVNIDEMTSEDIEGENLSGGYFFEYDVNMNLGYNTNHDVDEGFYTTGSVVPTATTDVTGMEGGYSSPVTIKSPDDILDIQKDYLRNFVSDVEYRVKNNDISGIDLDSFLKYFLTGEYTGNTDEFHEVYLSKKRNDDKLHFGPIWDGDLGYNNDFKSVIYEEDSTTIENGWLYEMAGRSTVIEDVRCGDKNKHGGIRHMVTNILQAPGSMQRLQEMWANLRGSGLVSKDVIRKKIDETMQLLNQSAKLNYRRWPTLEEVTHNEAIARGSYEAEVDVLRTYSNCRINWIDLKLGYTPITFELVVPESGWTTIYLPYAFSVPESMTIYQVNKIKNDGIRLSIKEVSATEPNKPYLVKAEAGIYELQAATVTAVDGNSLGLLTGTTQVRTAQPGSYTLQTIDGRTGFYRVEEGATINIDATQAYLCLPEANATACDVYYLDQSIIDALDINTDSRYTIEDLTHLIATPDATEFDIQTLRMLILNYKK